MRNLTLIFIFLSQPCFLPSPLCFIRVLCRTGSHHHLQMVGSPCWHLQVLLPCWTSHSLALQMNPFLLENLTLTSATPLLSLLSVPHTMVGLGENGSVCGHVLFPCYTVVGSTRVITIKDKRRTFSTHGR